jgi:hypothetical protein
VFNIGKFNVKVDHPIAEGGFAVVFMSHDTATGDKYALKKILAQDANDVR